MVPTEVIFSYGEIDDRETGGGFRYVAEVESMIRRDLLVSGHGDSAMLAPNEWLLTRLYRGFIISAAWQYGIGLESDKAYVIAIGTRLAGDDDPYEVPEGED